MRFIGNMILFFGGVEFLFGLNILLGNEGFHGSPGLHLLIGIAVMAIGEIVVSAGKSLAMSVREERAQRLIVRLNAGLEVESFALYLRPFSTTDKFHVLNPSPQTSPATPASLYIPKSFELEDSLATALEIFAPLVALGKPGGNLGAGKITVEDANWQQELEILAGAATVICVVPGHQDGTRWEIEYLRKMRYLNRTVFFMPPSPKKPDQKIDLARYWADACASLQQSGITLPPYSKSGLIFTLSEEGGIAQSAPAGALIFDSGNFHRLRETICSMIEKSNLGAKIMAPISASESDEQHEREWPSLKLGRYAISIHPILLTVLTFGFHRGRAKSKRSQ